MRTVRKITVAATVAYLLEKMPSALKAARLPVSSPKCDSSASPILATSAAFPVSLTEKINFLLFACKCRLSCSI